MVRVRSLEFGECDFNAFVVMSMDWARNCQRPRLFEFGLFDLFELEAEASVLPGEIFSWEVDVVEDIDN